jgi:glucose/arabinose dehydrogenase
MLQVREDRVAVAWPALFAAIVLFVSFEQARAQDFSNLALSQVADGLTQPIGFVSPGDGSGRMFIIEQPGRIRIYNIAGATVNATPFLDISSAVDNAGNEQGLLGLAFHPEFASNGRFYVNYTRDPGPGQGADLTVVAEYSLSANPDIANTTETKILELVQDAGNHNGGDLQFGPDGYLYIAVGDGGGGNDDFGHAQNIDTLKGAMLRIDVDGAPKAEDEMCGLVQNYGIPDGNPFFEADGCDEIWSFGLRNPFRFSFDTQTGDMLIGDVGQNTWEEIDFQANGVGGLNFGWSCREGAHDFANGNACVSAFTDPILEYSHSLGCSVTGGYVYRGSVQAFNGYYFYGDYCSTRVWLASNSGSGWTTSEWTAAAAVLGSISSFGQDETGTLYIADRNDGLIFRIDMANPGHIFANSFED